MVEGRARGDYAGTTAAADVQPKTDRRSLRDILQIAERAAEGGLKVVPGKEWALHYPRKGETRRARLEALLAGKATPRQVAAELQPDALVFDAKDLAEQGVEAVSSRILGISEKVKGYDYGRFAEFVAGLQGAGATLEMAERLYDGLAETRIQKRSFDAYGATGKRQMKTAMAGEARRQLVEIGGLSGTEKVLTALKLDWLCEKMQAVAMEERDHAVSELNGAEREIFNRLAKNFSDYIESGDAKKYQELVKQVRETLPKLATEEKTEGARPSESMQELQEELKKFEDQVGPPGTEDDPGIPPEDSDEYHTPPPAEGSETGEKKSARPIFEIAPPLGGYYISGRKSYWDKDKKTWSKKKSLTAYQTRIKGGERHIISGRVDGGTKSIPLPNGLVLDAHSLKYTGQKPEILRDQNGCFYLQTKGASDFSVDFVTEPRLFVGPPIKEDSEVLTKSKLSAKTENTLARLTGSALQKAEQARQYILANHFYPGGGDLRAAQALQYKLRSVSANAYIQELDSSEYLECYSANTLFITLLRHAGVPARLVIGHKVEGARKGKSAITDSSGHAWAEIWDGQAWRRFDATPAPKPEDKKKDEKKGEKQDGAPEAEDGGVEPPQKGEHKEDGEKDGEEGQKSGQGKKGEKDQPEDSSKPQEMKEASDEAIQQGEQKVQEAKEKTEKDLQKKKELEKQAAEAKKFSDLEKIKKEAEDSELDEEMKQEVEERAEAKEREMKDKLQEEIDKMSEDGFIDENKKEELEKILESDDAEKLDQLQAQIERESRLYNEYDEIREEVRPLVDKWFRFFADRLPRQEEVEIDEDSLSRQGSFNRHAAQKPRNLIFGTVKNPRKIESSVKPRFMASIMVDVSGSMQGEKLNSARKLLVFYSELFARISREYGYIRFAINIFSDNVGEIKTFGQDYDSPRRYDYADGQNSTVKVRLMEKMSVQGGTNMLAAVKKAAADFREEVYDFPNYASAFYFVGDGGDTCGHSQDIREFMKDTKGEAGFGEHMYRATLLGNEAQRRELAEIFGDEHTTVAPDFDSLIDESVMSFNDDIEDYLRGKTVD